MKTQPTRHPVHRESSVGSHCTNVPSLRKACCCGVCFLSMCPSSVCGKLDSTTHRPFPGQDLAFGYLALGNSHSHEAGRTSFPRLPALVGQSHAALAVRTTDTEQQPGTTPISCDSKIPVGLFGRNEYLHPINKNSIPTEASANTHRDPFDPRFRSSHRCSKRAVAQVNQRLHQRLKANLPFKIFCDLDGVLVDFEAGIQKLLGRSTSELDKPTMWRLIAESNTAFFETLPWTADGPRLWNAIQHLNPDILTGVPDLPCSRMEKWQWCSRHLGMEECRLIDMAGEDDFNHAMVNDTPRACPNQKRKRRVANIITCWSYNKHYESGENAVLIDDRIALKESWEAKGGIFVHHTNTDTTLTKLEDLGILANFQKTRRSSTQFLFKNCIRANKNGAGGLAFPSQLWDSSRVRTCSFGHDYKSLKSPRSSTRALAPEMKP